jgi:dTDP-4-dehydrorhamnose reductase
MKIFISGASGLVGGNCQKYFLEQGAEVLGTYFSFPTKNTVFFNSLDLADEKNADVKAFKPDVIVHCGALTHVDYCEDNEEESYQKTVQSTVNLLALAKECHARFVYISTDYVFDGIDGPYAEEDTFNPLGVYAEHKLVGEQAVQGSGVSSLILRITNVYGDEVRGKNFVARIIQQCKEGKELTLKLPVDQYATPVNALDVAKSMWLLLNDKKEGVYHIASTDYVNRVELALRVLKYFPEAKYELIPMFTEELNQAAERPLLGGLLTSKFSAEYPSFLFSNVDDYVSGKL